MERPWERRVATPWTPRRRANRYRERKRGTREFLAGMTSAAIDSAAPPSSTGARLPRHYGPGNQPPAVTCPGRGGPRTPDYGGRVDVSEKESPDGFAAH
ncbi:hypothetical protein GCM10009753_79010 [Streptantibioticus ferralitis]